MKKITTVVVASILGLAANAAMANMAAPNGFYVEGNIGRSLAHDTELHNSGLGYNVNVGYKFIPYLAAEFGGTYYAPSHGYGMKDKHYSVDAAAKGILPLGETGVDVFAKLGIAETQSHLDDTDVERAKSPYFGAGVEYALTSNLLANAQWNRARGNKNTGSLDLASVGLSYLF